MRVSCLNCSHGGRASASREQFRQEDRALRIVLSRIGVAGALGLREIRGMGWCRHVQVDIFDRLPEVYPLSEQAVCKS